MTTTSSPKPLELKVANFGPIAEANIELRPMSVFVGPSNTGKSYMATLIYALHKFFRDYGRYGIHSQSRNLSKENIATILTWAQKEHSDLQRAKRDSSSLIEQLLSNLSEVVASNISAPLNRPAYYLPADRAGVMHTHQSASRTKLLSDSPTPVLSGVLGDFMEQLVALADSPQREQDENCAHLAQNLEQTLLQGTIHVKQSPTNDPSFTFQPNGWQRDLPLMNASSMVSELAPVVLYLRHIVQPGDLLIIEEPESHLHPAMQVEFIRQLAAAVQSGVRILITTHSEWVFEELANLVRLSELPQEQREGIDDADITLSPDQVGAWLFEPSLKGNGSTVREIAPDTESAIFPTGFGLVGESLYNRWAEISTRIAEG